MKCSIKNINLPPAPPATHSKRVRDPKEEAAALRAVRKERLIRQAQEEIQNSEGKDKQRPKLLYGLDKQQRELAIEMWNDGKLGKEIAAALGISTSTMFGILSRMQERGTIKPRFRHRKVDKAKVLEELKAGKQVAQIAREYNLHRKTIQRWKSILKEEGQL